MGGSVAAFQVISGHPHLVERGIKGSPVGVQVGEGGVCRMLKHFQTLAKGVELPSEKFIVPFEGNKQLGMWLGG